MPIDDVLILGAENAWAHESCQHKYLQNHRSSHQRMLKRVKPLQLGGIAWEDVHPGRWLGVCGSYYRRQLASEFTRKSTKTWWPLEDIQRTLVSACHGTHYLPNGCGWNIKICRGPKRQKDLAGLWMICTFQFSFFEYIFGVAILIPIYS